MKTRVNTRAEKIDWASTENHLLLNPRLPKTDAASAERAWSKWNVDLQGHVGLLTSGSTSGGGRLVLLSKQALLTSAAAVNEHLRCGRDDVWLKTLPDFHVGGLGIHVRAHLSGARVANELGEIGSWNAERFTRAAAEQKATLVSLVPSQVFDLVSRRLKAPESLRAIIVGGGALSDELFAAATQLGWPVLPSYGLTECCSQVATASIEDWHSRRNQVKAPFAPLPMVLLAHVRVESDDQTPLKIQSASLLTARITLDTGEGVYEDPKVNGWFQTEDRARVIQAGGRSTLSVQGRGGDFLKIGGESTSLSALESKLQALRIEHGYSWDVALLAREDERLGHVIHLLAERAPLEKRQFLIDAFAAAVLPFERIRGVTEVARIPRSALGKLLQIEAKRLALT